MKKSNPQMKSCTTKREAYAGLTRDCLSCSHSMSTDDEAGEQILVCADCVGHEGSFITVAEDFCCENYN